MKITMKTGWKMLTGIVIMMIGLILMFVGIFYSNSHQLVYHSFNPWLMVIGIAGFVAGFLVTANAGQV